MPTAAATSLAASLRRGAAGPLAPALRRIAFALALLIAISLIAAPGTLHGSALLSMLPFAAMLTIAAIGQTLIVQHGGLDLSVAGTVSLAAAIVTKEGHQLDGGLPVALVLVLAAAVVVGLVNGLLVARLSITPLIATLGVNAILTGVVLRITGGVPTAAPDSLATFALDKTLGIPNTVLVALAVFAVAGALLRWSVLGRRHVAVGISVSAARHAGVRLTTYRVAPYVAGALCFALTGVLVAGFQQSPGIAVGNSYLIPTVAVVVLAGTPLTGGRASVLATAAAAIFLSQLDQLVLALGAPTAAQYLIQGAVIALGVAAREVSFVQDIGRRLWTEPRRRGRAEEHPPIDDGDPSPLRQQGGEAYDIHRDAPA
jgi:ribose transport system permease protein